MQITEYAADDTVITPINNLKLGLNMPHPLKRLLTGDAGLRLGVTADPIETALEQLTSHHSIASSKKQPYSQILPGVWVCQISES